MKAQLFALVAMAFLGITCWLFVSVVHENFRKQIAEFDQRQAALTTSCQRHGGHIGNFEPKLCLYPDGRLVEGWYFK